MRFQVLRCVLKRLQRVILAFANGGRLRARAQRMQASFEVFGFVGCRSLDDDIAELRELIQLHPEVHVGQPVGLVDLDFGLHFPLEVSVAAKEREQRLLRFLNVDG